MSVWLVNNANSSGVPAATLIRRFRTWAWISVQVIGAAAIRFSQERQTLETLTGSNVAGGVKMAGASTTVFQGWWIGDFWAIADALGAQPAQFNLEVMQAPIVPDQTYKPGDDLVQAQVTSSG